VKAFARQRPDGHTSAISERIAFAKRDGSLLSGAAAFITIASSCHSAAGPRESLKVRGMQRLLEPYGKISSPS
jgi:hypothetical protein